MPNATATMIVTAALLTAACEQAPTQGNFTEPQHASMPFSAGAGGGGAVLDVTTAGMDFDMPDEIPSGWTTVRYHNRSGVTHFFVIEKMPAGRTVEDSRRDVVPVFQAAWNLIEAGDAAAGFAEFGNLPAWFSEIVFTGGPGLIAPGGTAETTLYLEPGTYVVECYVKAPDGTFHTTMGMLRGLVVTDEVSRGTEPRAAYDVRVSNSGVTLEGAPAPGLRTFAVHFDEQMVHEHFLGHDVHLVRLTDSTDLDELATWMDWSTVGALTTPAPAEFLGGTQEMPAGSTAYFTALLTPGRYALIAEVPDPKGKNMLQTFSVPAGGQGSR
jgi:hypothetical protein